MKLDLYIPDKDKDISKTIAEKIKEADSAFITWHARPDGDAVGGGFALKKILEDSGVETEIISSCAPPETYNFINGINDVKTSVPADKKDLGFIIDCSDLKRLENVKGLIHKADTIINIDHHKLNHNFGDINYVRDYAASVCSLILNLALALDMDFDYDMALNIYVGILTDTNRFQEQNTTPRAHIVAAELIDKFINPVKISARIYGNQTVNTLKLIARALESLKFTPSGKACSITITPEMLKETDTANENLEGVINYARNIRGVEVGILMRKIDGLDGIKVSFRSKGAIDVGWTASRFSGGGHHNAAGCLIKGSFKEVKQKVVNVIEKQIIKASL
ncbi:MAG: bifunctional oligoribonuclease/PAP phosphatase NrnA [Elusimicrobia bacterium]|jgi:phosphoesterase RecJ-like protein|nr:bifunctional oligoribonuclease/PAP phosphatase NrnA [Elusimicrobiota bacterium]